MAKPTLVKLCARCGIENPHYTLKNGPHSWCVPCVNKYNHSQYRKHKGNHQKRMRKWNLKTKYNLSTEEFEQMLSAQNGNCKICAKPIDYQCAVDHCHTTGKVRGLLCSPCNSALGFFKERTDIMQNAINYLNTYNTRDEIVARIPAPRP